MQVLIFLKVLNQLSYFKALNFDIFEESVLKRY